MDEIQNELLGLSALDYESVESVREELAESLGYEPTEIQIKEALISLKEKGHINFYLYSESTSNFVEQSSFIEPLSNLWFMAKATGKGT
jgi:hypothetical protein